MTEQLLAAIEYLDAHTKVVLQKPKYRVLGDIDGKYNVIDPYFDIPAYPTAKELSLNGITKINPSAGNTAVDVVECDREKMVQSSRAKSAPAPFNEMLFESMHSRPMTSSSWAKDSFIRDDVNFSIRSKSAISNAASHTSIKRITFTPPGINVGPSNARDEVMNEIVNKPLVHKPGIIKSRSAPPSEKFGLRSAIYSSKRAKTSCSKRRRSARDWEKRPGPFMTVKVTGQDLWVVSNSTPSTYFANKKDDGLRMNDVNKLSKWKDTAETVPRPEQISPSIHERKLGAPAQFSPTIEWLKYEPSDKLKKPPVLRSYGDDNSGKYYSLESNISKKVSQYMQASPGVRIARNGEVLSHSMLLDDVVDGNGSDSEESFIGDDELDIISLLPSKLGDKVLEIRKKDKDLEKLEVEIKSNENDSTEITTRSDHGREEQNENTEDAASTICSEDSSTLSNRSEKIPTPKNTVNDEEQEESKEITNNENSTAEPSRSQSRLTAEVLARISGGPLDENPLLQSTDESSVSNTASSYESLNFQIPFDKVEENSEDEVVWKIMDSSNPGYWLNKKKYNQQKLSKQLKLCRKPDTNTDKEKRKQDHNTIVSLNWTDEISKSGAKVVKPTTYYHSNSIEQKLASQSSSLPVVFYKPHETPRTPSDISSRPQSAYSAHPVELPMETNVELSRKGYRAPVSTPRSSRSVRSKSASSSSTISSRSPLRPTDFMRHGLELASLLNVTPDSLPTKQTTSSHVVSKEKVTIVYQETTKLTDSMTLNDQDKTKAHNGVSNKLAKKHVRVDDAKLPRSIKSAPSGGKISITVSETKIPLKFGNAAFKSEGRAHSSVTVPVLPINLSGLDEQQTATKRGKSANVVPGDSSHSSTQRAPAPFNSPKSPSARKFNFDKNTDDVMHIYDVESPKAIQINSALGSKNHLVGRPKNGFAPSPLTRSQSMIQYETNRNASRGGLQCLGVVGKNSTPAIETLSKQSSFQNEHSKYIQIAQPIHIPSKTNSTVASNQTTTGNKMYDSYMHELSNANEVPSKNLIAGKSLGGTSGKGIVGMNVANRSKKQMLGHRPSPVDVNLVSTYPRHNNEETTTAFGIKGDQVRLNLDKNITVIVRDLEMLKKSKESDKISAPVIAKSSSPENVTHPGQEIIGQITDESSVEVVSNSEPLVRNNIEVHDSATQWSARLDTGGEIKDTIIPVNTKEEEMKIPEQPQEHIVKEEDNVSLTVPSTEQNSEKEGQPVLKKDILKNLPSRQKPNVPKISMINEEDEEEDDDSSVRGVTKVTVNIGSGSQI